MNSRLNVRLFIGKLQSHGHDLIVVSTGPAASQAEVARRAGLQRDAYGRYMLGKTLPPQPKLLAIAKAFGVDVREIDVHRDYDDINGEETSPPPFTIRPAAGRPGFVRLDISADLPAEIAGEVMSILSRHIE
ncbi:helix-turn-helix protein [Pseudoroseicyclus aestuarii]|uniref:Helix-turn-helix protein n=1 Tax=Pseudoroseicyclus aestuarii TaxID=1795041 RepID=A0A318SMV4_9RHOB|nr:helix-turn-helix protein [Pseudoroseicyclus aestuarii]